MTGEQTKKALAMARVLLPGIKPRKLPDADLEKTAFEAASDGRSALDLAAAHVVWMCEEATRFVDAGRLEKANRWLGFVQGALWGSGWTTIADLMKHNAPEGAEFDPNK